MLRDLAPGVACGRTLQFFCFKGFAPAGRGRRRDTHYRVNPDTIFTDDLRKLDLRTENFSKLPRFSLGRTNLLKAREDDSYACFDASLQPVGSALCLFHNLRGKIKCNVWRVLASCTMQVESKHAGGLAETSDAKGRGNGLCQVG